MAIFKKFTSNKCWRGCGEKEASYTVGGDVNCSSHFGEQDGGSLKQKIELPYDPASPRGMHTSGENHNLKRYMNGSASLQHWLY